MITLRAEAYRPRRRPAAGRAGRRDRDGPPWPSAGPPRSPARCSAASARPRRRSWRRRTAGSGPATSPGSPACNAPTTSSCRARRASSSAPPRSAKAAPRGVVRTGPAPVHRPRHGRRRRHHHPRPDTAGRRRGRARRVHQARRPRGGAGEHRRGAGGRERRAPERGRLRPRPARPVPAGVDLQGRQRVRPAAPGVHGDDAGRVPATRSSSTADLRNAEGEVLGTVPFRTDFAQSCNTAFVGSAPKVSACSSWPPRPRRSATGGPARSASRPSRARCRPRATPRSTPPT